MHLTIVRVAPDLADVDREDPSRIRPSDGGVDLGTCIPGVADGHEPQPTVKINALLGATRLLLATGEGAKQVAEQHYARREPVVADERHAEVFWSEGLEET